MAVQVIAISVPQTVLRWIRNCPSSLSAKLLGPCVEVWIRGNFPPTLLTREQHLDSEHFWPPLWIAQNEALNTNSVKLSFTPLGMWMFLFPRMVASNVQGGRCSAVIPQQSQLGKDSSTICLRWITGRLYTENPTDNWFEFRRDIARYGADSVEVCLGLICAQVTVFRNRIMNWGWDMMLNVLTCVMSHWIHRLLRSFMIWFMMTTWLNGLIPSLYKNNGLGLLMYFATPDTVWLCVESSWSYKLCHSRSQKEVLRRRLQVRCFCWWGTILF